MRSFLNIGSEISLQSLDGGENKKFHIERTLGSGATSLVYDAYVESSVGEKYYRIKECFPNAAGIRQNDGSIKWHDTEEKNAILTNFIDTQKRIFDFQYSEDVGNNVVKVYDVCRGNDTLYVVMETTYGNVYSEDSVEDLQKIIDTMIVLSKIIKCYHDKGYLHLDIKPDNFMVCYDPNIWIWLFDFDTVTAIDDIHSGQVKSVPYSPGWEAPEQRLGIIKKVGVCTDIYAIGAVLFYKLMGRKVEHNDLSVFADWDFTADKFKNINPKIVRLLRNVFDKTLSANTKRRYQNINELINALDEISKIIYAGKPYLKSREKESMINFFGRTLELQAIHKQFDNGSRAVFLHGDGGIGKSSLAIKYSEQYRSEYDAVIFMRYMDSLEALVDDVLCECIENCEEKDLKYKRRMAYDLMNSHTLLIVDNFDVEIDQDEYLDEFLEYKAHIIFTSRTDFSQVCNGVINQLEVKGLPYKDLMALFESASGTKMKDNDIDSFKLLVDFVLGNTYFIELFSRQIAATGNSVPALAKEIKDGVYNLDYVKVRYQKDGKFRKSTVLDAIQVLFDISKLSDDRRQVLRNMYLLRFLKIDREQYGKYTGNSMIELNVINDLIELGWIKSEHNVILYLHPLVEELILNELKPDEENCPLIYDYIKAKIQTCVEFEWSGELSEYKLENDYEFLSTFFSYSSFSIACNLRLVVEWLVGLWENEEPRGVDPESYYSKALFKRLNLAVKKGEITGVEECAIRYVIFNEWISKATGFRIDRNGNIITDYYDERNENLRSSYESFAKSVDHITGEEKDIWFEKLCNSVQTLLNNRFIDEFPKGFAYELYEAYEQYIELSIKAKLKHGFALTDAESKTLENEKKERETAEKEDWQIDEEIDQEIFEGFIQSQDKIAYVQELIREETSPYWRARDVYACVNGVYGRFYWGSVRKKYLEDYDWETLEEVLQILNNLLDVDELKYQSFRYMKEHCIINIMITYVLNGKIDLYIEEIGRYMENLWEEIMRSIEDGRSRWFHFTDSSYWGNHYLNTLINSMQSIGKVSHVFSYILQHCEKLIEYAKQQEDYEQEYVFPLYQSIAELAFEASLENDVPVQFKADYDDIEYKYRDLMDEMADNDYFLKIKR